MLKLGAWRKEDFFPAPPPGLAARLFYQLSKTRVSFRLLKLPAQPSAEDIDVFERLLPHVRLTSGVYRTTKRNRFQDLDPEVNAILQNQFAPSVELHVEDWAASDCLTSLEWAQGLIGSFPKLKFRASDFLLFLIEASKPGAAETFVFEPERLPLQYVRPPFVVRLAQPELWVFPLNRLLYRYACRRWRHLNKQWTVPESWMDPLNESSVKSNGYILTKLPLVHPAAMHAARTSGWFSIARHSVFESLEHPCHIIRTMNIFNREYFSEERLIEGIRSVTDSLKSDGIWVVGRTTGEEPATHQVTIFKKQPGGSLDVIHRIGIGSEIESLALRVSQS